MNMYLIRCISLKSNLGLIGSTKYNNENIHNKPFSTSTIQYILFEEWIFDLTYPSLLAYVVFEWSHRGATTNYERHLLAQVR